MGNDEGVIHQTGQPTHPDDQWRLVEHQVRVVRVRVHLVAPAGPTRRLAGDWNYGNGLRAHDPPELLAKVKVQGDIAIERIEEFKNQTDITIPLTYEIALVQFS